MCQDKRKWIHTHVWVSVCDGGTHSLWNASGGPTVAWWAGTMLLLAMWSLQAAQEPRERGPLLVRTLATSVWNINYPVKDQGDQTLCTGNRHTHTHTHTGNNSTLHNHRHDNIRQLFLKRKNVKLIRSNQCVTSLTERIIM